MTGRRWLGALMLLATAVISSSYASAPMAASSVMGIVIIQSPSSVLINGAPAISGTTVFRGDTVATQNESVAVVKLRSGASLAVAENSEVVLDLADSTAGTDSVILHQGAINLRNPSPKPDWVRLNGASVSVQGERGFPAICRVAMVGQSSAIVNERGHIEIRGPTTPLILPVGRYATLEAGRPQGGPQAAGKVTAQLPKGDVQRGGQGPLIQLKLSDDVFLGDLVSTETFGRVRIQLQDGSLLNVGARSQMRIIRHDSQSHQTAIELAAGKLRSQVTHTQGGSFQVTTKTAVIGVVGTHFLVAADAQKTRVWCFEGMVRVWNINPAIVGIVVLHAGEFTVIPLGLPPAPVSAVSPSQAHAQINQTDATVSVSGMGAAASVASVAASGGAAAGAGVAISRADSATTSFNQAGGTLTGVTSLLNSAAASSASAVNGANAANQGSVTSDGLLNGIVQSIVSPTYPCGCH